MRSYSAERYAVGVTAGVIGGLKFAIDAVNAEPDKGRILAVLNAELSRAESDRDAFRERAEKGERDEND